MNELTSEQKQTLANLILKIRDAAKAESLKEKEAAFAGDCSGCQCEKDYDTMKRIDRKNYLHNIDATVNPLFIDDEGNFNGDGSIDWEISFEAAYNFETSEELETAYVMAKDDLIDMFDSMEIELYTAKHTLLQQLHNFYTLGMQAKLNPFRASSFK